MHALILYNSQTTKQIQWLKKPEMKRPSALCNLVKKGPNNEFHFFDISQNLIWQWQFSRAFWLGLHRRFRSSTYIINVLALLFYVYLYYYGLLIHSLRIIFVLITMEMMERPTKGINTETIGHCLLRFSWKANLILRPLCKILENLDCLQCHHYIFQQALHQFASCTCKIERLRRRTRHSALLRRSRSEGTFTCVSM